MKLDVKEDRIEINKIIENCLPLMKLNKKMTQECADCIIVYFIERIPKKTSKKSILKGFKKGKCKCGNTYAYCGLDIGYCVKCIDKMKTTKK